MNTDTMSKRHITWHYIQKTISNNTITNLLRNIYCKNYAKNILTIYCGLGIVTPRKKSLFEKISMCLGNSSPVTQVNVELWHVKPRVTDIIFTKSTDRCSHDIRQIYGCAWEWEQFGSHESRGITMGMGVT